MTDLHVIQEIEKQIQEPLNLCDIDNVMSGSARCSYALNEHQQVIGLNLQNCRQTNLEVLKNFKNLTHLNLSLNQITEITALKNLEQLKQLNLQKNNINELTPLKNLTQLTQLNLQDNQISELRPLRKLKKLNILNLQANLIDDIKYLAELDELIVLNLSSNALKELTALNKLTCLKYLNLSANQIFDLSPLVGLRELTELDLRFNQIIDIFALKNLTKLSRLYLSKNKISDITALFEIKSLTQLYLSDNQISDLYPLKSLEFLTELDLRNNKIVQVDSLINSKKLTNLHLENNQIVDITPLEGLTELVILNLRNNQITYIEPLKNLKNLNQLYLSNNKIQALPKWILDFNLKIKWNSGGEGISVIANPLKYPPSEIIRQGNLAIKGYFENLEQQQQRALDEIKICFVGDSLVGKTSLIQVLCENKAATEPVPSQGISIVNWRYQNMLAHCWDFGGNETIQATQSAFFSAQAVYVLVLDNRPQRNEIYWLKKIEWLAGDVPVLVVLNKCEQAESYDVDREYLIKSYNCLQANSFFSISCTEKLGIEEFKQGLISTVKQMSVFKKLWRETWIEVKEVIEQQLKQHYYLSESAYIELCQKYGVHEKNQQQLLQWLYELGVAIHFKNFNPETYILEPHWLVKSLYKIISFPEISEKNGVLLIKELAKILNSEQVNNVVYTVEHYRDLINLMRCLEWCFVIDKNTILITPLLKNEEPDIDLDLDKSLKFKIHYGYLDKMIMPRLSVLLREDIENENYWRDCVVFSNKSLYTCALVKADYTENLIIIQLIGENQREYFNVIRNALLDIENSLT